MLEGREGQRLGHPDQVAIHIAAQDELAERVRASKPVNHRAVDRHFEENAGEIGRCMRARERNVELVDAAQTLDPPKAPIDKLSLAMMNNQFEERPSRHQPMAGALTTRWRRWT